MKSGQVALEPDYAEQGNIRAPPRPNVDALRVSEGDPLAHQLIRLSALQYALNLRQLNVIIDAYDLVCIFHDDTLNTHAIVNS